MMRGEKIADRFFNNFKVMKDWPWTHPTYTLDIGISFKDIIDVKIDISGRLADTDKSNDTYPRLALLEAPTE